MTPKDIRLASPILGKLMLSAAANQGGNMAAPVLFRRLPSALRGFQLTEMGDAATRAYNTRRAPGTRTPQVKINWKGKTYTIDQHSIDVPIPRELVQEQDVAMRMNVGANIPISKVAINTGLDILTLSYEREAAAIATDPNAYAGNVLALSGGTKWSAATGTPVTDIRAKAEVIRKKVGRKPNVLVLSPDALNAIVMNPEVKGYLPSSNLGPATLDQLKVILKVKEIVEADAIWTEEDGTSFDVWGNNAILAYSPDIGVDGSGFSLGQPAFGFTGWMEGHPFVEVPYYDNPSKSWIYGATFERTPTLARGSAGFLFQNPA